MSGKKRFLTVCLCLVLAWLPEIAVAQETEDPCRDQGFYAANLSAVDLWYKRDGGPCTFWQKKKIVNMKAGENLDLFSDLTCETRFCKDALTYDTLRSSDNDRNCRVKLLFGCELADM